MRIINYQRILRLLCGMAIGLSEFNWVKGVESELFDQKDKTFWVLKNKEAFCRGAELLIDGEGKWKGNPPAPEYIKFCEPLTKEDLPTLKKWLSLKNLTCFAIADENEQPNLKLILNWYRDIIDPLDNIQAQEDYLARENFYKLAWLDFKSSLHEIRRGEGSSLPAPWVETNRDFQMKNSHYTPIGSH